MISDRESDFWKYINQSCDEVINDHQGIPIKYYDAMDAILLDEDIAKCLCIMYPTKKNAPNPLNDDSIIKLGWKSGSKPQGVHIMK
jgi:hypothetical protein